MTEAVVSTDVVVKAPPDEVYRGFVEPDLWCSGSASVPRSSRGRTVTAWNAMNGQQGGDPAKLADALLQVVGEMMPSSVVEIFETCESN